MRKTALTVILGAGLLWCAVSFATREEEMLGIVPKEGRISEEEALARSQKLLNKYDNAKAALGEGLGVRSSGEASAPAPEPEDAPAAGEPYSPFELQNTETSKIILKNGQSLNVSIESKGEAGMWVTSGGPDMRFYIRNDEVREILSS